MEWTKGCLNLRIHDDLNASHRTTIGSFVSDFLVLKNVKVENSGRAKGSTFPTFSEDKVKTYFKNNKIALNRDQDQLMNITCIPHFGG